MITLLLVDDHNVFRQSVRGLLELQSDFRIVGEVEDGREAVRVAQQLKPQVVVMDVSMPVLNGIDSTAQIRTVSPDTSVVALSGYSDSRFISDTLKAGARGYLLKTCHFDELVAAIRTVASGGTYLSPQVSNVVVEGFVQGLDGSSSASGTAPQLSRREREVLQLLAEGRTTKEIAADLGVSISTIDSHRSQIMSKLNLHSVAELTKFAVRSGLTSLE